MDEVPVRIGLLWHATHILERMELQRHEEPCRELHICSHGVDVEHFYDENR